MKMKRTTKPNVKSQELNKTKLDKIAASVPSAPKTVAKPVTAEVKPKRTSHLKLGPALLGRNASEKEIKKAFTDSFNARGKTDQAWIDGRIKIYMNLAHKAVSKSNAVATTKARAA
jgi:hypothetical protein